MSNNYSNKITYRGVQELLQPITETVMGEEEGAMMMMVAWRRRPMVAPRRRRFPSGLRLGYPLGVLDPVAAGLGDED